MEGVEKSNGDRIDQYKDQLRMIEEKLKVKENENIELSKKVNTMKLKFQSLQRQKENKPSTSSNRPGSDQQGPIESGSAAKGKLILLKKQLEESRQLIERQAKEKSELTDTLEKLKELASTNREDQIDDRRSASALKAAQQSPSSTGSKDVNEMFAQIVYKDTMIMDLNQRCLDLEKHILDLEESLKEKDEVLRVRNRAINILMTQHNTSDITETPLVNVEEVLKIEEQKVVIENLGRKVDELEMEKGNLQLKVMELEGTNGSKPPIIDIELERDALKREKDQLLQKLNELHGYVDSLEIEKNRLEMEREKMMAETRDLNSKLKKAEILTEKFYNKIEQLEASCLDKDKKMAHLASQAEQAIQEVNEKEEEISVIRNQMSDLAMKSKNAIAEKEFIISRLRIELDGKEDNILSEKDEQLDELKHLYQDQQIELQNIIYEKDLLNTDLNQRMLEIQNLKLELEDANKAKEESFHMYDALKNETFEENERLQEELDKRLAQLEELSKLTEIENESLIQFRSESQSKLVALEKEYEKVKQSNIVLSQMVEQFKLQLKQADDREDEAAHQHNIQINSMKEDRKRIENELQALEDENVSLKNVLEEEMGLRSKMTEMKSLLEEKDKQIAYLNELMEKLTESKDEESSSSRLKAMEQFNELTKQSKDFMEKEALLNGRIQELLNEKQQFLEELNNQQNTIEKMKQENAYKIEESEQQNFETIEQLKKQNAFDLSQLKEAISLQNNEFVKRETYFNSVIKQLENEKLFFQRELEELYKSKDDTNDERTASLQNELQCLKLEHEKQSNILKDEEAKISKSEEHNNLLTVQIEALKRENKKLFTELDSIKGKIDDQTSQTSMNEKLNEYENELFQLREHLAEKESEAQDIKSNFETQLKEKELMVNKMASNLKEMEMNLAKMSEDAMEKEKYFIEKIQSFETRGTINLQKAEANHYDTINQLRAEIEFYKSQAETLTAQRTQLSEDKDQAVNSLKNEVQSLVNQIEFERSDAQKMFQNYEQKINETMSQYNSVLQELQSARNVNVIKSEDNIDQKKLENYKELETKFKKLALKYKIKEKEVLSLEDKLKQSLSNQSNLTNVDEEMALNNRQLEELTKKLEEAQFSAKNLDLALNDERNKRRLLEDELEKFWLTKSAKLNEWSDREDYTLFLDDPRSLPEPHAASPLNQLKRSFKKHVGSFLSNGPPRKRLKKIFIVLYLVVIHLVLIKMCLF